MRPCHVPSCNFQFSAAARSRETSRAIGGLTRMGIKGLFLGLLLALGACTGKPDGVEAVRGFDATRYLGVW